MFQVLGFFLILSFSAHAFEDDFKMRVSWTKTLISHLGSVEKTEGHKRVYVHKKSFNFSLIDEAWADSKFNCFFSGWPSTLKKNVCQHPSVGNPSYDKKACKLNEFQCQPLLFGKGQCVPANEKAFEACENKISNFDHLENLNNQQIVEMREMALLAGYVCSKDNSPTCQKVKFKLYDGLKSIDKAQGQMPPPPIPNTSHQNSHADDCDNPEHEHELLASTIMKIGAKSLDDLYDKVKSEFQSSPMCDPLKIVNDPAQKPSPFIMSQLMNDLKAVDFIGSNQDQIPGFMASMSSKWKVSPEVSNELLQILNRIPALGRDEADRKNLTAKAKGIIIQDMIKNYVPDGNMINAVKNDLVQNKIFTRNDQNQIECPFVSKDAFVKALLGREKVLKEKRKDITNKGQITIVDYTRPSNERRLFVIDLDKSKVLHNTWVAHGSGGGSEIGGKDGFGSSPEMSNVLGSNKSSEGFIVAAKAFAGESYGPNVLLTGIDNNNDNLAKRSVVLHGWGSPMDSYATFQEQYNPKTEKYDEPYDVISRVKKTDFRNGSTEDMEKALTGVKISTAQYPHLNSTEGCLGVSKINVKHLDRKGRDKSQLELLREDLPGSMIFNYSGPEMKSKYF